MVATPIDTPFTSLDVTRSVLDAGGLAQIVSMTVQLTKVALYKTLVNPTSPNRAWWVRLYTWGVGLVYTLAGAWLVGALTKEALPGLWALSLGVVGIAVAQYHVLQDDPVILASQTRKRDQTTPVIQVKPGSDTPAPPWQQTRSPHAGSRAIKRAAPTATPEREGTRARPQAPDPDVPWVKGDPQVSELTSKGNDGS